MLKKLFKFGKKNQQEVQIDEVVKAHKDIVSAVRDRLKKLCKKYLKCVGNDWCVFCILLKTGRGFLNHS